MKLILLKINYIKFSLGFPSLHSSAAVQPLHLHTLTTSPLYCCMVCELLVLLLLDGGLKDYMKKIHLSEETFKMKLQ